MGQAGSPATRHGNFSPCQRLASPRGKSSPREPERTSGARNYRQGNEHPRAGGERKTPPPPPPPTWSSSSNCQSATAPGTRTSLAGGADAAAAAAARLLLRKAPWSGRPRPSPPPSRVPPSSYPAAHQRFAVSAAAESLSLSLRRARSFAPAASWARLTRGLFSFPHYYRSPPLSQPGTTPTPLFPAVPAGPPCAMESRPGRSGDLNALVCTAPSSALCKTTAAGASLLLLSGCPPESHHTPQLASLEFPSRQGGRRGKRLRTRGATGATVSQPARRIPP